VENVLEPVIPYKPVILLYCKNVRRSGANY